MNLRIGQGYDVHRFGDGGPLVVGGVPIPWDRGVIAHSDGDVLLHAIADALLGALADGDIGRHFPDDSPQWQGADSAELLARVHERVRHQGYRVNNVDATIVAQAPRMAPYIDAMRGVVAGALEVDTDRISVKATTTERLGSMGREEGIAAQAVVLLVSP
ncbi:2-C-methyl-D-erythritol 2,4-cyclodiphosphate synthase [Aquisalimonas lutea]|uniref:2-C-methyl-D-erythritol 2,4-cyclodiphosphate synthase n=1 Tax=Aquisalimonas lutea TaxID=1327750 RepID=UPI0025B33313|nr:2-C-methyl-D-erythritol 2,4-cyclodiphosphate synthase [Aquisalimonas lutea]MDN3518404.1 2-C-methyl-D-erythritol 2,4-cyclodiphosphate synthase [Aquisalimonas lutea]